MNQFKDEMPLGASKFGGLPDLPKSDNKENGGSDDEDDDGDDNEDEDEDGDGSGNDKKKKQKKNK